MSSKKHKPREKAELVFSERTINLRQALAEMQHDPNASMEDVKELAIACAASAMGDLMDYEEAQSVIDKLMEK